MADKLTLLQGATLDALQGCVEPAGSERLLERLNERLVEPVDEATLMTVLTELAARDLVEVVDEEGCGPLLYQKLGRRSRHGRMVSTSAFLRFDWSSLAPGDYVEGVGVMSSPSRCALLRDTVGVVLAQCLQIAAPENVQPIEDYRVAEWKPRLRL